MTPYPPKNYHCEPIDLIVNKIPEDCVDLITCHTLVPLCGTLLAPYLELTDEHLEEMLDEARYVTHW